jgi:hypothetical protein
MKPFELPGARHLYRLADILDCLTGDQLWALLYARPARR